MGRHHGRNMIEPILHFSIAATTSIHSLPRTLSFGINGVLAFASSRARVVGYFTVTALRKSSLPGHIFERIELEQ